MTRQTQQQQQHDDDYDTINKTLQQQSCLQMATKIVINPTQSRVSVVQPSTYKTQSCSWKHDSITTDHLNSRVTRCAVKLDQTTHGQKKSNESQRRSGAEVEVFIYFFRQMIVALLDWGVPGPSPDPGQRHGRTLDPRPGGSARGPKTCDLKSRLLKMMNHTS